MLQRRNLLPLAKPEALGIGLGRRSIGRKILEDPEFPPLIRISGRLYVEEALWERYKELLINRGLQPQHRSLGADRAAKDTSARLAKGKRKTAPDSDAPSL